MAGHEVGIPGNLTTAWVGLAWAHVSPRFSMCQPYLLADGAGMVVSFWEFSR